MSAIEASLRLEIAQYQQQLARATASVAKFKEDAKRNSQGVGEAVMGRPEDWVPKRANMAAFRASMASEGEAGGGMMLGGLRNGLTKAGGIAAIGLALAGGVMSSAQKAIEDEVLTVRMNVLVGNKDAAAKLKSDLRALGASTPLEFPELATAGQSLIAFGESAKTVPATLRRIGDMATGVGAPVGELAELYGKARVQGTLFAEDINQLTGRGIPVIQEFARILGVTEGQVKKLASEGKITFPLLEAAFKNLTREGGKFGGMMEEVAKTSSGKWSTFKDEVGSIQTELGKPVASLWGGVLDLGIASASKLGDLIAAARLDSSRRKGQEAASDAQLFAGYNAKKDARKAAEDEAKLKSEFQRKEQEAEATKAREKATKAAKERGDELKHLVSIRSQVSELSIAMLPDDQRLQALKERMSDIFVSAQLGAGKSITPSADGLMQLAGDQKAAGNTKGEAATLGRLQEVLKIEKEIQAIREAADKKSTQAAADEMKLDLARKSFALQTQISQAQVASAGVENATIKAFQDQLNTLQLQAQIREQLKLSESESLRMAKEKVAAERAASEAAKTAKQGEAKKDLSQDLAVLRAQAAGKEELARKMQQEIDAQREAKRIAEETGMSEQQALRVAREKVQLKQQIENQGKSDGDLRYDSEGRRADGRKKINARIEGTAADRQDHLYGAGNRYRNNQAQTPGQAGGLGPKAERNAQKDGPQTPDSSNAQLGQQILQAVQQMLGFMQ